MEKEHKREIFESFLNRVLCFTLICVFLKVFMMEDLLRLVMRPLDPISNGSKYVVHPESSKSDFKSLYFLFFKM